MFTKRLWTAGAPWAVLVLAISVVDGCSSDGENGNGASGQSCESSDRCTLWACTCNDGTKVSMSSCANNLCRDGEAVCGSACSAQGGVQSFREKPTVKDSAECSAFCDKAASLGCSAETRCEKNFYCSLDDDECADKKRAHLRCVADEGKWACSASGGWTVTSSCPSARCDRDAGAD